MHPGHSGYPIVTRSLPADSVKRYAVKRYRVRLLQNSTIAIMARYVVVLFRHANNGSPLVTTSMAPDGSS